MSYEVDTITEGDWRVVISQDEDCESPRSYDQLGTLITWDRNYNSPDPNDFDSPEGFEDWWNGTTDGRSHDEEGNCIVLEVCPAEAPAYIRLPVFKYEHSGVAYRTSDFGDRWDSGQVGWIFTTPEKIDNTGAPEDSWAEQLKNEVEEYSKWANGQCYGYSIQRRVSQCTCGECEDWEEIDDGSCWGFIGACYVDLPDDAPEELKAKLAESYYVWKEVAA